MCSQAPISCGSCRAAAAAAPAARLLLRQDSFEREDDQDAAAQHLEKIAPCQFEMICRPGGQFVPFRLESRFDPSISRSLGTSFLRPCRRSQPGEWPRRYAGRSRSGRCCLPSRATISGSRRMGILLQQADARHDHSRDAVTALHGAGFEKGFLQRMQPAVLLQAFDGRNLFACDRTHLVYAGPRWLPVDQHCAGAALALATAVFRSGQIEVIAQDAEKTSLAFQVNAPSGSVDAKLNDLHKNPPRLEAEEIVHQAASNDLTRRKPSSAGRCRVNHANGPELSPSNYSVAI